VALLGDNGAGKSTLVKIIAGGHEASSGHMLLKGRNIGPGRRPKERRKELKRSIRTCRFAPMSMSSPISSWDGDHAPLSRHSRPGRESHGARGGAGARQCRDADSSLRANVEHLSGGQRQAIELNRFVHWGGKLVLLDEPFAALGVEQTRRGLDMIRHVASQGIGVIIITHIMQQAFQVADRIVVIRQA
jgi:D-xylose transport system ATP-binding protein